MKYSVLASGKCIQKLGPDAVEDLLLDGIKVDLLFASEAELEEYSLLNYKHFNKYVTKKENVPNIYMEDGVLIDGSKKEFQDLEELFPQFNYRQYVVEHMGTENTIIVKASAGTGKTKVMLDRIMFLLATIEDLRPSDICMITFTRAAARSMLEKLQDRLMDMFLATGSKKYLEIMEEMSEMNISTIDSFFFNLVKQQGFALGYGKDIKISSHIYEKQQFIEDAINERFKEAGLTDFTKEYILPIHEYKNLVKGCWDKLNGRGYYGDAIKSMDFGSGQNRDSDIINENLKNILYVAEKNYTEFTKKKNSFAISDIRRSMVALSETVPKKIDVCYRFVFIDEFQDTDDGQIKCVAWLKKYLNCQLFVVGDVKQSIYRFRGAEEKSFDTLKREIDRLNLGKISEEILIINYRTRNAILARLNTLFSKFGRKGYLEWEKDVYSYKPGEGNIKYIQYERSNEAVPCLVSHLKQHRAEDTCVLVRSNYFVRRVSEVCRTMGIPCVAVQEGNFYRCEPVLDVINLLGALVYPTDNHRLFNYLLSPYCSKKPDPATISACSGDEELVREYLQQVAAENGWEGYVRDAGKKPIFQLIKEIVKKSDYLKNYQRYKAGQLKNIKLSKKAENREELQKQINLDLQFYSLNLNKLMSILGDNFSSGFVSLLTVYEFLVNKMQTEHDEDAIYPDITENDKNVVQVMTIHKSKGLEFNKVLVLCGNNPFIQDYEQYKLAKDDANSQESYEQNRDRLDYIAVEDENTHKSSFGWFYTKNNKWYANSIHKKIRQEEDQHIVNEEIRLLYVALTRVENELAIILPDVDKIKGYTWASYIYAK